MPKNKTLAGAALAAALTAACGKPAPAPADAAPVVNLSAPAPSSATVASPLGAQTSDYTNEMQAQNLRDQSAKLGIAKLTQPSAPEDDERGPMISAEEGMEHTREMTQQLAAQRRAIDKDRDKSVSLPSSTPGIIPSRKQGAPIEPPPEEPAPKDPETK